jgi:hypothetical protein
MRGAYAGAAAVTSPYLLAVSSVRSATVASAAAFLTASMPFSALAFFSYAWLAAMISPLAALRCQRNLPALSLLISNHPIHPGWLARSHPG